MGTVPLSVEQLEASAGRWLAAFTQAIAERSDAAIDALFTEKAAWRDLVAFTWNLRQVHDRDAIRELLWAVADDIQPSGFQLDPSKPGPTVSGEGARAIEAFFEFETAQGRGEGLIFLEEDPTTELGVRANILFTQLMSLNGVVPVWPRTDRFDETHPDERWAEHVARLGAFADRDPEVLIAGGGQHGVMTAAALARLGVDALIVDKQPRVGDAWRSRYDSLILHQPHGMLYFSHIKYPESFPEYIPKDKLADFFESYVSMLDLNFWTSTEFLSGVFDKDEKRWTVELLLADGTIRVMHPKHVVLATGGTQIPTDPGIEGLDDFTGRVLLGREFRSGEEFAGKEVLVVGAGTSAHDFAQDIGRFGGHATLLQRSPLSVVNVPTANALYGDYNPRKVPTEELDRRFMATFIYPILLNNLVQFTKAGNEQDRELHEGLQNAGFRVLLDEGDRGFFMKYFERLGGYYINVGGSDDIISGKIGVIQANDVERVVPEGVLLESGDIRRFDAIVLATGYKNVRYTIEAAFGKEVADKIGDVWDFDDGGELRNVWKPTSQEALWIMMGGIPQARWYAPVVALMIKADIDGSTPAALRTEGHLARTPGQTVAVGV